MSHEIDGNRMFSVKLEPWHRLGTILDNPPTSAEAIRAAGMAWQVQKRKLFWEVPLALGATGTPAVQPVPNRVALVRDEDEAFLALASNEYQPLQNVDAFAWFDPIIMAGQATYETAGVLRGGRRVWILAKLQSAIVAGDEHKQYVLLTNGHDGSTGVSISPVSCRVVCANTLRIALGEGNATWFQHTGDMAAKLEAAKHAFSLTAAALAQHNTMLAALSKLPLNPEAMGNLLDEILGIEEAGNPTDESEVTDGETTKDGPTFRDRMKERILELHETGMGATPATRGTAYGLLNSITEFVDHFAGARSKDRGNYTLFGDGDALKSRALEVLSELVSAKS